MRYPKDSQLYIDTVVSQMKQNLPKFRFWAGLSQTELADLCGIPQPRISDIERGEGGCVSPQTAKSLAQALGCQIKDLVPF